MLGSEIYLVEENGSLRSHTSGVRPWRYETHGGYVSNLIGEIPVTALPPSEYTFYVAVTPAGIWAGYYLWTTTLGLP